MLGEEIYSQKRVCRQDMSTLLLLALLLFAQRKEVSPNTGNKTNILQKNTILASLQKIPQINYIRSNFSWGIFPFDFDHNTTNLASHHIYPLDWTSFNKKIIWLKKHSLFLSFPPFLGEEESNRKLDFGIYSSFLIR